MREEGVEYLRFLGNRINTVGLGGEVFNQHHHVSSVIHNIPMITLRLSTRR